LASRRIPQWIRFTPAPLHKAALIEKHTYKKGLSTICKEARCPNRGECASKGTASFLILGNRCTRTCSFCAVQKGTPLPIVLDEPELVASSVASLNLEHVVITSVTRDDLTDGGAEVFCNTVRKIRVAAPNTTVEVLVPDFRGNTPDIDAALQSAPDVFAHNVETAPRLYPFIRPQANFKRSLDVLMRASNFGQKTVVKTSVMVGLGETKEEMLDVFRRISDSGCQILTIGQYLQPTPRQLQVHRFLNPSEFQELEYLGIKAGIRKIESGPMVRSSYRSAEALKAIIMDIS
jgi:lipoyl synthase